MRDDTMLHAFWMALLMLMGGIGLFLLITKCITYDNIDDNTPTYFEVTLNNVSDGEIDLDSIGGSEFYKKTFEGRKKLPLLIYSGSFKSTYKGPHRIDLRGLHLDEMRIFRMYIKNKTNEPDFFGPECETVQYDNTQKMTKHGYGIDLDGLYDTGDLLGGNEYEITLEFMYDEDENVKLAIDGHGPKLCDKMAQKAIDRMKDRDEPISVRFIPFRLVPYRSYR